ncbi:MAG: carboxypeptidase-like regulatory domain-containing protein, partial [Candidatus Eremiobacteraeota bacterium]|nr:carboxypeptidase-like regulatory domain-containing protein [Candidatus Eremiobacteraeota bacterium]
MSVCHSWRHAAVTCMAAACVFVFSLVPALAGSTGNLTGSVMNQKGAAVAGASISAVAASGSYKAVSDSHGFYSILNMSPDTYALTVTSSGYETSVT